MYFAMCYLLLIATFGELAILLIQQSIFAADVHNLLQICLTIVPFRKSCNDALPKAL